MYKFWRSFFCCRICSNSYFKQYIETSLKNHVPYYKDITALNEEFFASFLIKYVTIFNFKTIVGILCQNNKLNYKTLQEKLKVEFPNDNIKIDSVEIIDIDSDENIPRTPTTPRNRNLVCSLNMDRDDDDLVENMETKLSKHTKINLSLIVTMLKRN